MLVDSPRLSAADRRTWAELERYDHRLGRAASLRRKADEAMAVIRDFGHGYVSTSWGKDSTVLVDLVGRSGAILPVVWVRIDGYDLPECEQVRDLMLARHPHLAYDEITLPPHPNRWWDPAGMPQSKWAANKGWRAVERRYGKRRITGIRAEESKIREMVMAHFGDATENTCRPIGRWSAVEIFAYLAARALPAHPAYAASHAGSLDRRWLRVHSLGGVTGSDHGRSEWESHYYGDVIRQSRLRDYLMGRLPLARAGRLTASEAAAGAPVAAHDAAKVLAQLEARAMVISSHRVGQIRWRRTVEWPAEIRWLQPKRREETETPRNAGDDVHMDT